MPRRDRKVGENAVKEKKIQDWLNTAVSGIRFWLDREKVEEELRGHLEDKTADLQRIFHLSREEAEEMALKQMGDAEEIGKELARIHRPWLGRLWRVSQVVLAVTLAAAVVYNVSTIHGEMVVEKKNAEFMEARGTKNQNVKEKFWLDGVDPIGTYQVHRVEGDPVECELVELIRGGDSVRVPNYRIRVARAALWDFVMPDGSDSRSLFCDLRAAGRPWEPLSAGVLRNISAVDSAGNYYESIAQWYPGYLEREIWDERRTMGINAGLDDSALDATPFEQMFSFEVRDIHPEAAWLRLEYTREDVSWSLTIPFGEEGEK